MADDWGWRAPRKVSDPILRQIMQSLQVWLKDSAKESAQSARTLADVSTTTTVVNTTTQSDLFSLAIPSGLGEVGDHFHVRASGDMANTSGAARTELFRLAVGSLASRPAAGTSIADGVVRKRWVLDADVYVTSTTTVGFSWMLRVSADPTSGYTAAATLLSLVGGDSGTLSIAGGTTVALSVTHGHAASTVDARCHAASITHVPGTKAA